MSHNNYGMKIKYLEADCASYGDILRRRKRAYFVYNELTLTYPEVIRAIFTNATLKYKELYRAII